MTISHQLFVGGRYLRAFDAIPDIDQYCHHILIYLGSRIEISQERGFIDQPCWPSINTIARDTKMSRPTVLKKIKFLKEQGYITVDASERINHLGNSERTSNIYRITAKAFSFYKDEKQAKINTSKPGLPVSFTQKQYPLFPENEDSSPQKSGECPSDTNRESPEDPNISLESKGNISGYDQSSSCGDGNQMIEEEDEVKNQISYIVEAFKEVTGHVTSALELEKFTKTFVFNSSDINWYLGRIDKIGRSPYLKARAKSINFLFGGLELAKTEELQFRRTFRARLSDCYSLQQIDFLVARAAETLTTKNKMSFTLSDGDIEEMFENELAEARQSLQKPLLPEPPRALTDDFWGKIESPEHSSLVSDLAKMLARSEVAV